MWISWNANDREQALAQKVRELEAELAVARLENELLAKLNASLQEWLAAETAMAAGIVQQLGGGKK
jgi:hypothetical protein